MMHFTTGVISVLLNPRIAPAAVVLPPLVINEDFCNYRGGHMTHVSRAINQNGSLRLWKQLNSWLSSQVLPLISTQTRVRVEKLHQSLVLLFARLLFSFTHTKKCCNFVVSNPRTPSVVDSWTEIASFLPFIPEVGEEEISFPLLSDCQICRWLEISKR